MLLTFRPADHRWWPFLKINSCGSCQLVFFIRSFPLLELTVSTGERKGSRGLEDLEIEIKSIINL